MKRASDLCAAANQRFSAKITTLVGKEDINGVEIRPLPPLDVMGQVRIEGKSTNSATPAPKLSQIQFRLEGPGSNYGGQNIVKDDGSFVLKNVEANTYNVVPAGAGVLYTKGVYLGDRDITDSQLDLSNGLPPRGELTIVTFF